MFTCRDKQHFHHFSSNKVLLPNISCSCQMVFGCRWKFIKNDRFIYSHKKERKKMSCGGNFTKPSRNATHSSSKWQIHAIHSNSEIHHVPYVYFVMKMIKRIWPNFSCIYYSLEIVYFWIDILKMFSCTIFVNKAFTT